MRKLFLSMVLISAGVFGALNAPSAYAQSDAIYTSWKNNLGAGGYDTVTYFSGVPQKGKSEYSYEFNGATWLFSTQSNLDMFVENPADFMPQYGGYCSWAVAKNKLAKGDPLQWSVVNGRLYLNYNKRIKQRWEEMQGQFILDADGNWPEILAK